MKMESSTNGAITLCRYEILWIHRTCDYIQLNGWSDTAVSPSRLSLQHAV